MNRVVVVGSSGSGKTTVARAIAERLSLPRLELDSVRHRDGWDSVEEAEFSAAVRDIADGDRWVIDGNYTSLGTRKTLWPRADTVVWLDPPRWRAMARVVRRTLKRVVARQQMWGGGVTERWSNVFSLDPHSNIIVWTWTNYAHVVEKYEAAIGEGHWNHASVHRLRTPREVRRFLTRLGDGARVSR